MVPGVGLSPDRMLQGRVFAYADAHRYRVGTNHQQLPVNAPRCPVHSYQRDGAMAFGNYGSAPNYEPNSYSDAPNSRRVTPSRHWPCRAPLIAMITVKTRTTTVTPVHCSA